MRHYKAIGIKICTLYYYEENQTKEDEMCGGCDTRNASAILDEIPEGKRPLQGPRHRWEDIKMDLK
jgi:hypothetical protein